MKIEEKFNCFKGIRQLKNCSANNKYSTQKLNHFNSPCDDFLPDNSTSCAKFHNMYFNCLLSFNLRIHSLHRHVVDMLFLGEALRSRFFKD